METKDILKAIRTKHHLTQDDMADKLFVTRQAVSRWENGDLTPKIETLKQISITFDVSINTLLGSPRKLICQCCGMPLDEDDMISREVISISTRTIANGVTRMGSLFIKRWMIFLISWSLICQMTPTPLSRPELIFLSNC